MPETEELVRPAPSHGDGAPPRVRHIARLEGQALDDAVTTLCGLRRPRRTPPPPRPPLCGTCRQMLELGRQLDAL